MNTLIATWKNRLPGLVLVVLLALPAWFLGQAFPVVGAPVFGILIGLILAWLLRQPRLRDRLSADPTQSWGQSGLQYSSKKILQYAVILLGFGLNLQQIVRVGQTSLIIIVSTISIALISSALLYRVLKIDAQTAVLVGVGSSICGGSAIAATAPVIEASEKRIAQAMSVIFFYNVLAALLFPTLGQLLGMTTEGFGLFAGTAVNDTSSVTAAAAAWDATHPGGNALEIATIVKLTRTLAIIPITLVLAALQGRRHRLAAANAPQEAADVQSNGFSLKRIFPFFILYFLIASVITTWIGLPPSLLHLLRVISKFFIVMAMTAIGLKTDLVDLIKTGGKPLLQGLICWILIALTALGLQHLQGLW